MRKVRLKSFIWSRIYASFLLLLTMFVVIGLERTDNNMDLTTWPVVGMINQKNYYTFVVLARTFNHALCWCT